MFTAKHQKTLDDAGINLKGLDIGQLLAIIQAIMAFIASLHKNPAKMGSRAARAVLFAACLLFGSTAYANDASVRVEHYMPDGSVGIGTGTVVSVESGNALVITNQHVCPDAGRGVVVRWADGKSARATWLGTDPQADLCALTVAAPMDCSTCPLAQTAPENNSPVAFYGYRGGFHPLRRVARILGFVALRNNLPVVGISAPSIQGDSGSGVLNDSGELVAVVWGGTHGAAQCVNHDALVRFLSSPTVRQQFTSAVVMGEYETARAQALAEGKRFVVFCGEYTSHAIPGCVVCELGNLRGKTSGIVVGVPERGDLTRVDLPAGATDAQILSARPAVPTMQPVMYQPVMFGGGCANGRCGR